MSEFWDAFTIKGLTVNVSEVEYIEYTVKGKKRGSFREKRRRGNLAGRFVKANGLWHTDITVRAMYKTQRSHKNRRMEIYVSMWSIKRLSDEQQVEIGLACLETNPNSDWFDFYNQTVLVASDERFRSDREAREELKELIESDGVLTLDGKAKVKDLKGWGITD